MDIILVAMTTLEVTMMIIMINEVNKPLAHWAELVWGWETFASGRHQSILHHSRLWPPLASGSKTFDCGQSDNSPELWLSWKQAGTPQWMSPNNLLTYLLYMEIYHWMNVPTKLPVCQTTTCLPVFLISCYLCYLMSCHSVWSSSL